MVPHVAARGTHQRSREIWVVGQKGLFHNRHLADLATALLNVCSFKVEQTSPRFFRLFIAPSAENPMFRKTEATSISTRRSTLACSSGGVPIQRIARPTSSNGRSARRLIPPSCKLPCGLTILAQKCPTNSPARDVVKHGLNQIDLGGLLTCVQCRAQKCERGYRGWFLHVSR